MRDERIEGTILLDNANMGPAGALTGCAYANTVAVDWEGMIQYAVIGEPGSYIFWFAGAGQFAELDTGPAPRYECEEVSA